MRDVRLCVWSVVRGALCLCVGIGFLGCGGDGGGAGRDLSVIGDDTAAVRARVLALRSVDGEVAAGRMSASAGREVLKEAAWDRGSSAMVRIAAIEELLEDGGRLADTRRMFELMLPTEVRLSGTVAVVERIGREAAARGWVGLTPALVRSWSVPLRGVEARDRPERSALVALHGAGGVPEAVWGVFEGSVTGTTGEAIGVRGRRAAWQVLVLEMMGRDEGRAALRSFVAERAGGEAAADGLAGLIGRGARELGVVPMSAEELAWLERLRDRHPEFWGEAASVVSTLGEEQWAGLELRHLAGVVYAARFDAVALELGRRALAEGIEAELDGRRSVWRARSRAGGLRSEAIEGWRDEMSWGDLLLVRIAARLIGDADAEVRGALAALGDRDLADTTTEHGGVLDADERGGLVMYHYPPRPRDRVSDTRMVASDALIEGSATALFHFHMHARSYDSAEWAGPSAGDFAYAGAHGRSCVVFTFLDANTLNADYYQPAGLGRGGSAGLEGGATIDLGVIRRPTGG